MKKQKRILQTLLLLMAGGGLAMLSTACSEHDSLPVPTVPITFYLQSAGSQNVTRAYEGEVAAVTGESDINEVKVWLFNQNTCISYSENLEKTGDATKVTMSVPQNMVGQNVDVYIIANAKSAGLTTLNASSTVADLTAATLTGTNFTPGAPTTAVPADGLPMSRIAKGLTIEATSAVTAKLPDIKITRAVSKIRFAFGRPKGHTGEIIGISLNGGVIASQEFIFPVDPATNAADYTEPYLGDLHANIAANAYESSAITFGSTEGTTAWLANTAIPEVYDASDLTLDASSYAWATWKEANSTVADKAKAYNTLMDTYTKQTVYLRESDKKLSGTVYYRTTATGAVQSATFQMDPESTVHDFARNHIWIVYSYFMDGKLYINPTIADWIDTPELSYTLKMNTNIRLFDSWLYRYDTDGVLNKDNYSDWKTSHMAVSSGRETDGRPSRSPQIQLVTTGVDDPAVAGSGTFELYVDNTDFEILRANKGETGVVTSYEASTNGTLTIPAGDDVYTYFYVVPKDGVTPANPVAKVFLYYNDPLLGKVKVTYNNNMLPGYSDDSSEMWVYYVTPENYKNDGMLKMYYQNAKNPLVPTPDQN